ncbi:plasmid mobilization protein [Mucilaginibacter terrae]|uniref:Plasmid mobilization relaxosome protein MobC n=1 Tax=Mucilaginibacter terrae TaxID=1955052 RepID=A0ABU3GR70_9SPHI|nr:plasmid mobilization relaxosome protein MobC [Mucilaginibacter terrae]MDT3402274.1 hypothetical protein [Mucilaginibacter terrae]
MPPLSEVGGGLESHLMMGCIDVEEETMAEENEAKKRFIGFRLSAGEYESVEKGWKKTTLRKLSEYVRRVLMGKTITVYTRNKSLDDLMEEMVLLRRELNAIGVNFNQAVHRLHTLDHLPQMQLWLTAFERDKGALFGKVEAIKSRLDQLADEWLL